MRYGSSSMSPSIGRKVLNKLQQMPRKSKKDVPDYQLTPREKEILACIVNSLSYKMITADLAIGYETVRSHVNKIYEKLPVASLTAMREKIV